MSTDTKNFKYADIDIEAGIQKFEPLRINIDDKYLYCVASDDQTRRIKIAGEGGEKLKDDARLYKAERKLIERILVKQVADKYGNQIIPVNNARFLVRPDSATTQTPRQSSQSNPLRDIKSSVFSDKPTDHADFDQDQYEIPSSGTKFSAVVITWNGQGSPPEKLDLLAVSSKSASLKFQEPLHDSPFERIWNRGRESNTPLRFHWTKVVLFDRNDELDRPQALQGLWNVLRGEIDSSEFTLHHVPCKLYEKKISMRDALFQIQWAPGANSGDQTHWYDVVQALLKADSGDQENVAVLGNSFYELDKDSENNKIMQGLLHCLGKRRTLSLNAAEEATLTEQICPKLFFMPGSVADFMVGHFGEGADQQMLQHLDTLQKALRGKLVQFKVDGSKITRGIESVSSSNGWNVKNNEMHPSWRGKIGLTLQHPDLPCVNVGTKFRPALLPPEMVMLVPGQSFKPFTQSLRQEMAKSYQQNANVPVAKFKARNFGYDSSVDGPVTVTRKLSLAERIAESIAGQAQLTFITAGVEKVETPLWTKFRGFLHDALNPNDKNQVEQIRPIFLKYKPGQDVTKLWIKQLANLKKNAKAQNGKKPIAVVLLKADEHHAYLYKVIKTLCDTEVGLQCFVIKLNTLEQKQAKVKDTNRAAEMAAKVIAKKIAVRNPNKSKPLEEGKALNLSVAVHVERITVNAPKPKPDGSSISGAEAAKTVYVVVLSSRDTEKSDRYCTKTELVGPEQINQFPLADRVKDFVQDIATKSKAQAHLPHRVVILRSGYMTQSEPQDHPQGRRLSTDNIVTIPSTTDVDNQGIYSVDNDGNGTDRAPVRVFNMNQMINSESSACTAGIKVAVGPDTSVSYVLVSQDKSSGFTENIKKSIEHVVTQKAEAGSAKLLQQSFFVTDPRVNPSQNSIGTYRNVHVKNSTSLVTLTLHGDPLADDTTGPASLEEQPPKFGLKETSTNTPKTGRAASGPKDVKPSSARETRKSIPPRLSLSNSTNLPNSHVRKASEPSPLSTSGLTYVKSPPSNENASFDEGKDVDTSPSPKPTGVTSPSLRNEVSLQKRPLPSNVKKAELSSLSKLWCDDRLELYNTNFPIPTHLAHLAAKRAQMHMRYDNFDDAADDAAPCALDPVHDDVKDTLYFL
ncbi:hypothetical protein PRZ48_006481 [Zasmidium cellare]|uniref:PAZ domain-containing protein n=1 Tax=Zasmidium cellare TaxID=395010 RepID=A0ABR0ENV6_ZASCE|nr:hypothetical protein PRZ48_006481 [Zasmidium cellare]